jgi:hydroxymethylpyrimidine/phosphomethylpyrimidine kinase
MTGRVLIIAGSDSGGGAGIQADTKTVTVLGGYAATAITALTAQNTQGVFGVHEVPTDFIKQQIDLVLSDIGADVIKTGMLANADVIKAVDVALADYADIPLVVDPVMVAKGGAPLLHKQAVDALVRLLLPRAVLVTPNIPEAELLTGMTIQTLDEMKQAGHKLIAMGASAALIKGGHREGGIVEDVLVSGPGEHVFTSPRIHTKHTHGTGCTLASAIACYLAKDEPLQKAVQQASDYVQKAIQNAPKLGNGHGPLGHFVSGL